MYTLKLIFIPLEDGHIKCYTDGSWVCPTVLPKVSFAHTPSSNDRKRNLGQQELISWKILVQDTFFVVFFPEICITCVMKKLSPRSSDKRSQIKFLKLSFVKTYVSSRSFVFAKLCLILLSFSGCFASSTNLAKLFWDTYGKKTYVNLIFVSTVELDGVIMIQLVKF